MQFNRVRHALEMDTTLRAQGNLARGIRWRTLCAIVAALALLLSGSPLLPAQRAEAQEAASWQHPELAPISPAAVTTLAGSGSGPTAPGTGAEATLNGPTSIATQGGFIFTATSDLTVVKTSIATGESVILAGAPTTPTCTLSTEGTGVRFSSPVESLTSDGRYLYGVSCGNSVLRIDPTTGGTSAILSGWKTLAVTAGPDGMLYTADNTTTPSIGQLNPLTGTRTGFVLPPSGFYSITADPKALWGITSSRNIYRIDLATKAVTLLAGGGNTPYQYDLASAGDYLYAAARSPGNLSEADLLRRYSKADGSFVHIAGSVVGYREGTGADAAFHRIRGMASDGSSLFIADQLNNRVRRAVDAEPYLPQQHYAMPDPVANGAVTTLAGSGPGTTAPGTSTSAILDRPTSIAVQDGFTFTATSDLTVVKTSIATGESTILLGSPTGNSTSSTNCTLSTEGSDVRLNVTRPLRSLVSDGYYLYGVGCGDSLMRINPRTGGLSFVIQGGTTGVAVGPDGALYTVNGSMGVSRLDPMTGLRTAFATTAVGFQAITADAQALWAQSGESIYRIDLATKAATLLTSTAGGSSSRSLSSAGEYLFAGVVAPEGSYPNSLLRRYSKVDGSFLDIAGSTPGYVDDAGVNAKFDGITGVVYDGLRFYVADQANHRVRALAPLPSDSSTAPTPAGGAVPFRSGTVTTLAGSGPGTTAPGTVTNAVIDRPTSITAQDGFTFTATSDLTVVKTSIATGESTILLGSPTGNSTSSCTFSSEGGGVRLNGGGPLKSLVSDGQFLYGVGCGDSVVRIDPLTGGLSTVVQGGTKGVTAGPGGMLYATDGTGNISQIDLGTGARTMFATVPVNVQRITSDARALWVSAGSIYRIDLATKAVALLTSTGGAGSELTSIGDYLYSGVAASGVSSVVLLRRHSKTDGGYIHIAGSTYGYRDGTGADAAFASITGVVADGEQLYVADQYNHRVRLTVLGHSLPFFQPTAASQARRIDSGTVRTLATVNGPRSVTTQGGFTFASTTDLTVVKTSIATGESRILLGSPTGNTKGYYLCTLSTDGASVRLNDSGPLKSLVSDGYYLYGVGCSGSVVRINPVTGGLSMVLSGSGSNGYTQGVTVGPNKMLYLVDEDRKVSRLDPETGIRIVVATIPSDAYEITADFQALWVQGGGGIYRVDLTTKEVTLLTTDAGLDKLTSAGDYLYTGASHALRRYSKADGSYIIVAGLTSGYGYRDGTGTDALFNGISGVVSDGDHLYVGDTGNNRVRVVLSSPLVATTSQVGWSGSGATFPGELTGGSNPSQPTAGGREHGDPVATDTGMFNLTETDMLIGGRGFPLSFSRTYASNASQRTGPHGYGWAWSYGMKLAVDTSTTPNIAKVTQENGSIAYFRKLTDGTWEAPTRSQASLTKQPDGKFVFERRHQAKFVFSAAGQLLAQTDPNGYSLVFHYSSGLLWKITEPGGRYVTIGYDSSGRVKSLRDHADRFVLYDYSAAGDLISATDVAGRTVKYGYDALHRLTTITTPRGLTLTNTYDTANRVVRQDEPQSRVTLYAYTDEVEVGTMTTTITSPTGMVTKEVYENGNIQTETIGYGTPLARSYTYEYDPATNHLVKVIDPKGRVATTTYDAKGNVLTSTDAKGRTTSFTYNVRGQVLTTTDPLGRVTSLTYDQSGNLLTTARTHLESGAVQATRLSYDPLQPGDVRESTDARGKVTKFEYNQHGYLVKTTDPLGRISTREVDSLGRALSATSPLGNVVDATAAVKEANTTHTTYNAAGQVLSTADELDRTTSFIYDVDGQLKTTTDPLQRTTTNSYDQLGQLTSVLRPDGQTESTAYDKAGRVLTRIDPMQRVTRFEYDILGQRTQVFDPMGGVTSFEYDAVGSLTKTIDAMGRATVMSYDENEQLTGVDYADPATRDVSYTYDQLGRQLTATSSAGTISYSYDSLGRLTSTTSEDGRVISYGYDIGDQQTSLTYPGTTPRTVSYGYNEAGEVTSLQNGRGGAYSFTYDGNGRPEATVWPNGVRKQASYDVAHQLTGIDYALSTVPLGSFDYGFDAGGQYTQASSAGTPAGPQSYTFDPLGRLTKTVDGAVERPTAFNHAGDLTQIDAHTQQFNDRGQLTSRTNPPLTSTVTSPLGGALTETTSQPDTTYEYNGVGGRTTRAGPDGNRSYSWDQAGRLTSLGLPNSQSAAYTYDSEGLRRQKVVTTPDGATTTTFLYDRSLDIPLLLQESTREFVYGPDGTALEQTVTNGNESTTEYLHTDALGSVRLITNALGTVVGSASYTPYGTPTYGGTARSPLGFSNQYTDSESGHIYLRARYYEPETGQFLSRDPIWDQTGEPYSYAAGNPLQLSDPSGLWWGEKRLKSIGKVAVNFAVGYADSYTGGASTWMLQATVGDGWFDRCSKAFKAGGYAQMVSPVASPGKAIALAGLAKTALTAGGGVGAAVLVGKKLPRLWSLGGPKAVKAWQHKVEGPRQLHNVKFYQDKAGLVWSKDTSGHAVFKVHKPTGRGLVFHKDADEFGRFIETKHKGSVGQFIPWDHLTELR